MRYGGRLRSDPGKSVRNTHAESAMKWVRLHRRHGESQPRVPASAPRGYSGRSASPSAEAVLERKSLVNAEQTQTSARWLSQMGFLSNYLSRRGPRFFTFGES